VPFENVLPRLRSPLAAMNEPHEHWMEVPAERDPDLPVISFTCDGVFIDHRDFEASKMSNEALLARAAANLAKQRGSWRVEEMSGRGFMGTGKKYPQVMSLTHPLAAEHVLIDGFCDELVKMMPKATIFIPCSGAMRCASPEFAGAERKRARRDFVKAGKHALCPIELHASPIVGQAFALGAKFVDAIYATPAPAPIQR
jgi:hypothetical protein